MNKSISRGMAIFLTLIATAHAQESPSNPDSRETTRLEDVVVSPGKTIVQSGPAEGLLLGAEARRFPMIDNDLYRVVQRHPGVTGGDFTARFTVRGGEADETLVLLDGMEVYEPFHLQDYGGALSIIDLLAVKRARLYVGGHPAAFGDRLSSVLDVQLRAPSPDLSVDAGLDFLNAHVFTSAEPFFVSARAGYIGLLMGMMDSDESLEPHYGDVLAKFSQRITDADELAAYVLYGVDTNRIDNQGVDDDVRSRYQSGLSWVRWRHRFASDERLDLYLYGGLAGRHRREGAADLDDRDLAYGGVKAQFESDVTDELRLKAGADGRWMRGEYTYSAAEQGFQTDARVEGATLRGFVSGTWKIADALLADLGARCLVLGPKGGVHVGPALSFEVDAGLGLTVLGAFGIYYQPIDPLHLPVEAGQDEMGKPERAFHYVVGLDWKRRDWGSHARVELYHKDRDRLVGFIPDAGQKSQIYWPKDKAFSTGVEATFDQRVEDVTVHLAYTWSVTKEIFEGRSYFAQNDRRHAASLGLSWDAGYRWRVYAVWNVHTGEPYTRRHYEGDVPVLHERNAGRLPPYHSLDVRVGKTFVSGETEIQVYVQVLNLYNRANVHEYSWAAETDTTTTVFERDAENLFPLLPSIGVNVKF